MPYNLSSCLIINKKVTRLYDFSFLYFSAHVFFESDLYLILHQLFRF